MFNIFNISEELTKKSPKVDKQPIDFSVDFSDFKINIPVDEFAKEHNLDMKFIDFLDDISSTAKFGKLFRPTCLGGFLRRWFNGETFDETQCDVDLFFVGIIHGNDFDFIRQSFKDFLINSYEGKQKTFDLSKNYDMTIEYDTKTIPVQLMSLPFSFHMPPTHDLNYAMMKSMVKFDNINSMIGYNADTRTLVLHKNFVEFNKNKHLVFNTTTNNTSHPLRIFDRFEKFIKIGYSIPECSTYKVAILNYIVNQKSKFESDDNYNHD